MKAVIAVAGSRPRIRVPNVDLPSDEVIVARLRARDESMFAALLGAWSPGMLRTARGYVADEHAAQDVLQETWLGILHSIDGFESRSSLRTWAYRILVNRAMSRGSRDARAIPVPAASLPLTEQDDAPTPEAEALASETRRYLAAALKYLPDRQRVVVTLRDVEGYSSDEVCEILDISSANQRVLLHRGRAALQKRLRAVALHLPFAMG